MASASDSLISRAEQISFVPDPLGSDDQVIQFEVSDGDCGENKQPDGSKWSDCDGGKIEPKSIIVYLSVVRSGISGKFSSRKII